MIKGPPNKLQKTPRTLGLAGVAGLALGLIAQLLRQMDDPLMTLGAATAPWLTIGFVLSLWLTRPRASAATGLFVGIAAMASYLFAWLLAYHTAFAIREAATAAEAWREAAPWAVVAIPASLVLGAVVASAQSSPFARAVCLALPITWSLPEIVATLNNPWGQGLALIAPTAAFLLLLFLVLDISGRDVVGAVVAAVALGALGLAAFPILRSYIHS